LTHWVNHEQGTFQRVCAEQGGCFVTHKNDNSRRLDPFDANAGFTDRVFNYATVGQL
jgi:hypothetical protein